MYTIFEEEMRKLLMKYFRKRLLTEITDVKFEEMKEKKTTY